MPWRLLHWLYQSKVGRSCDSHRSRGVTCEGLKEESGINEITI